MVLLWDDLALAAGWRDPEELCDLALCDGLEDDLISVLLFTAVVDLLSVFAFCCEEDLVSVLLFTAGADLLSEAAFCSEEDLFTGLSLAAGADLLVLPVLVSDADLLALPELASDADLEEGL